MKLQIALDFDFDYCKTTQFIPKVADHIDIIEAGTPFLMEEGLSLLKKLKSSYPEKKVLADLKIADAGFREAENAFLAGADIVTVLSVVENATILGVLEAARKYKKAVLVDMLGASNLEQRIREIDAMGADYICLHTSKDLQKLNTDVSQAFSMVRKVIKHTKLAIAGGITAENIKKYAAIKPDLIIVGEGITLSETPEKTAEHIRTVMSQYS